MTRPVLRCQECGIADAAVEDDDGFLLHPMVGIDGEDGCLRAALNMLRECRPFVAGQMERAIKFDAPEIEDAARNLLERMPNE